MHVCIVYPTETSHIMNQSCIAHSTLVVLVIFGSGSSTKTIQNLSSPRPKYLTNLQSLRIVPYTLSIIMSIFPKSYLKIHEWQSNITLTKNISIFEPSITYNFHQFTGHVPPYKYPFLPYFDPFRFNIAVFFDRTLTTPPPRWEGWPQRGSHPLQDIHLHCLITWWRFVDQILYASSEPKGTKRRKTSWCWNLPWFFKVDALKVGDFLS